MEGKRQKLVGRDKGSLTEQQTEGTGTTTIQKRGKHKTNQQNTARRTQPLSLPDRTAAVPSRAVSEFRPPSSAPPEPSMTAHGMEYPALFGQVGSAPPPPHPSCAPSWILVKINPVLTEPRTSGMD